jgi:hypothetical protein
MSADPWSDDVPVPTFRPRAGYATDGCGGADKQTALTSGRGDTTILSCGPIAPLVGWRARIVAARLDTYRPSPCPPARVDGRCFSRPRPQGFYSTSGACSVSPFTTMVRSSFRRRRQEVYVGGFSCAAQLNGMNPEHLFSNRTDPDDRGLTVNAVSTIRLLESIEALYPLLVLIHVFLDNARYHHARLVQEWLARPGLKMA